MFDRIWQMLIKEFLELKRDKWARFRLVVPPLIQMLIFGYAATFEVYHVPTIVLDRDHTMESRDLISRFTSSDRFRIVRVAETDDDVENAINRSDAALAIVVHAGFTRLLRKGQEAPLQVILDGTNSNTALISLGYLDLIVARYSQDYMSDLLHRGIGGPASSKIVQVTIEPRPWYNPDLNGRWFFVPGVVGSLTLVLVVSLTASAIVREREVGTLEQIMVTPIRPAEYILGKTVPFFIIGLAEVALVALFGTLWFRIPFAGNPLVLLLGTSLFLLSTLGLGLLISTVSKTQQQAFASNFFVVNPMFTLSGFSFPIASMPEPLQWLTYLDPLRYYLVVIRATFLKGVGLDVLWPDMLGMAALGAGLLTISILRFRKSLD
ncbi:MAG TPA: ABC transporter permease [Stellaceae bacterium]|nr:ABC transporter permease [Stellaceae bacterium]